MPDTGSRAEQQVSIVRNPHARSAPTDEQLAAPLEAIRQSGWIATVRDTAGPGDARLLARAAAVEGANVVVVCGGDGTVNEAVNGLAGTQTALGVIPSGTANVWAREVGITGDAAAALGLLDAGRQVRVDTGVLQIGDEAERHFLLMCSAGLDADVVQEVEAHPRLKHRLGRGAFGWPGLRALVSRSDVETSIRVDGVESTTPLLMALAGNTRLYGSVMRLAGEALMDDGLLDLVTFEGRRGSFGQRAAYRARVVARALRGHLGSATTPGIRYQQASHIELRPRGPLPVQADGEFIGFAGPQAPLRVRNEPRSLTVLVPGGVNPLFGRNSER
jgi:YegS/Rv2252/BmrU family lipid kinase